MLGDGAVGRAPQHSPVLHGDDEQVAVGQPTETGGLTLDVEHALLAAVGVVGEDAVAVEVRRPPAAVVPAWALEVGAALEQDSHASPQAATADFAVSMNTSSSRRVSGPHGWKTTSVTPLLGETGEPFADLIRGPAHRDVVQHPMAARGPGGLVGIVEADECCEWTAK